MSFSDLGLSEKVQQAVAAAGYTTPTPIQASAIPHVLQRRDVLGIAQTGTGKTAAFTLPMLTLLEHGRARARMPRTLILEPTRELAAQVQESFEKYGVNHKLSVALLIGGVSFSDQDAKISRGVDVLIATPGRLLDHFERGKLLLTGIEVLVIDEADRMLDMGFIPDIERICRLVPFTRQTLFFSATMPPEIQRLTETFLHNPVKVEVARASSTAATITQRLVASGSEQHQKRETLRRLIRSAGDELQNGIIFCNRKRDVAIVVRSLQRHGFNAVALHGDMDQRSRMQALDSFRNGSVNLLVASDVAARGLDIPAVSHVFNFDVPHHAEDYVHRIGRTGRAGRTGYATTIVAPGDEKALAAIEALTGQTIPWAGPTLAEFIASVGQTSQQDGDHRRGQRGSRDRDRGRGKGERRTEAPAQHAPITPDGRPSQRQEERRGDRNQQRHHGDRDEVVVGFGDHVPSFILRPVVIPPASDEDSAAAPVAEEAVAPAETAAEPVNERSSGRRRRGRRRGAHAVREAAAEAPPPAEAPVEASAVPAPEAPATAEELAQPASEPEQPDEPPALAEADSERDATADEPAAPPETAPKPRRRTSRKASETAESAGERPAPKKRSRKATAQDAEPAGETEAPAPRKAASRKPARNADTEATAAEAGMADAPRTARRKKAAADAEVPSDAAKPKKASSRKAKADEAASESAHATKTKAASRKTAGTGTKKSSAKAASRKTAATASDAPAAKKPRSRKAEVAEAGD